MKEAANISAAPGLAARGHSDESVTEGLAAQTVTRERKAGAGLAAGSSQGSGRASRADRREEGEGRDGRGSGLGIAAVALAHGSDQRSTEAMGI